MRARRIPGGDPETAADGSDEAVRAAAAALAEGELLVHPTETVYGIGGISTGLDAEIGRMKGRSRDRPLLRIGPDVDTIRACHPRLVWSDAARRLAEVFWPGPLTLVLDDGSRHGLGVRVEGHPLTRRVLSAVEATMSSTSLNRTGGPPARAPSDVEEVLEEMPEPGVEVAWIEAGPLPGEPPSTVISLGEERVRVIRHGAVGASRLEEALDREVEDG